MFLKDYKLWRVVDKYGDYTKVPFPSYECTLKVHSALQNMPEIPVNTKGLTGVRHPFHYDTQSELITRINRVTVDMADKRYDLETYRGADRLVLSWATASDTLNTSALYKSLDNLLSTIETTYPNRDRHLDRLLMPIAKDCIEYLRLLRRAYASR